MVVEQRLLLYLSELFAHFLYQLEHFGITRRIDVNYLVTVGMSHLDSFPKRHKRLAFGGDRPDLNQHKCSSIRRCQQA